MPSGLVVYNDANTVQIDETYRNFTMIRKGTVTTYTPSNEALEIALNSRFDIVVTGTRPLVAIHTTGFYFLQQITKSGSTHTFRYIHYGAPGTVVTYYVFDMASSTQTANFGLVIRNANNEVTFASESGPLRIVDVKVGDQATGENYMAGEVTNLQTYNFGTGKTYATVFGHFGYRWNLVGPGGVSPSSFYSANTRLRTTSTGVEQALVWLRKPYMSGSGIRQGMNLDYQFMVIDVSNY